MIRNKDNPLFESLTVEKIKEHLKVGEQGE
jgi:hypothetical protein